jgi:RNA polymerase sigma-70 factor (ECF subfamily)
MTDLTVGSTAIQSTAVPEVGDLDRWLGEHRLELTRYCSWQLGSAFEAEDAVQETLVRAWRGFDRFEGRGSLRSWLYSIATNVCLDMLNGRQRRAHPIDLTASTADAALGSECAQTGADPIPHGCVPSLGEDPAEQAVARETVRFAIMATLLHLPPRQRAVLILREVLRWKAIEVADLLGTSVASVNSALQRARATLAARNCAATDRSTPLDDAERGLLARYVEAFELHDFESLASLLRSAP